MIRNKPLSVFSDARAFRAARHEGVQRYVECHAVQKTTIPTTPLT